MRRELPTRLISAVFVGAIGCSSSGLDDTRYQTGSQTMVASSDYKSLYVANVDHGTISRVTPVGREIKEFDAGSEPTRIARAGNRVFVTLRGERAVAVFNENGNDLTLETKIQVGAEPYGVVANEKGDRVYVASSLSYRVDEIDAEGLTLLRSWPMPAEPRWLALHPSNNVLFVGSPFYRELIWVDLSGDSVNTAPLPSKEVVNPFGGVPTGTQLTPRITGDMSVSPRGFEIAIPALYADNTTPIDDTLPPPPQGYYGGTDFGGGGTSRLNPVLVVIPTGNNGEPLSDYGFVLSLNGRNISGYPAAAIFDPNGETVFTPVETANGVIAVSLENGSGSDDNALGKFFNGDNATSGFAVNPIQIVGNTGLGARSVVFLEDDEAFSHAFIDSKVTDVRAAEVRKTLDDEAALFGGNVIDARIDLRPTSTEVLPEAVARGRKLFYNSVDARISGAFTGLSCAACHFEGRNDGLTWAFAKGDRQTPSLAGDISVTNPVRWEGDRPTVQEDAKHTAKDAMGGGATGTELDQLALDDLTAFIDWNGPNSRDIMFAVDELDQAAVARGKSLFERADVACATCHVGERYTNNQMYSMLGMRSVKTRPLTGVVATAPYFHDGSAATLMDVLLKSRDGSMGNTSALSDQEMHDLEQYLRSL